MSRRSEKPPPVSAASAIGGKTARACDSCVLRRARWYCAADDAFLCHPCDSSVHSANPLARRHERLRLKSILSTPDEAFSASSVPMWHHGFKRKARTPRPHHKPVVPELESSVDDEIGDEEVEEEEEEEQLLYRVPVFDPALAFAGPSSPPAAEFSPRLTTAGVGVDVGGEFSPTEMELAEFAADMESLLGRGLDSGQPFCMEELGLVDEREGGERKQVQLKGEEEEDFKGRGLSFEMEVDLSRETIDLDFGCGSPEMTEETAKVKREVEDEKMRKGMGLRLNYEAVMEAWLVRRSSPWISDERPQLGAEDFWIQCMGIWGGTGGEMVPGGIQVMNVGREAKVTRYREKRRTRLFSKKIRYEVRKLNAEKRPRMKGRFVKRASFTAATASTIRGGSATC